MQEGTGARVSRTEQTTGDTAGRVNRDGPEIGAPTARRSAREGIPRVVGFLVLVLVTVVGTESLISTGLRSIRVSTFGVMNAIVDGRINASILVTGSSRALAHFDSRLIQAATGLKTYNIGVDGSQIDMQVAVLKTYLRHNAKPVLLIHSLDAFSFVTSHGGVSSRGLYMPFLDEVDLYEALSRIDGDTWKARHLPLYRYVVGDPDFTWWMGMRAVLGWNPPDDRYLGFQPTNRTWTGEFERRRQRNPAGVRFEVEAEGVRVLEDALALCDREGISVLLVYSPDTWEMQELHTNRDEVFAVFKELAARHRATFWDYSGSPISYGRQYLYNSQHLNAQGAALFSADLAAALTALPVIAGR